MTMVIVLLVTHVVAFVAGMVVHAKYGAVVKRGIDEVL